MRPLSVASALACPALWEKFRCICFLRSARVLQASEHRSRPFPAPSGGSLFSSCDLVSSFFSFCYLPFFLNLFQSVAPNPEIVHGSCRLMSRIPYWASFLRSRVWEFPGVLARWAGASVGRGPATWGHLPGLPVQARCPPHTSAHLGIRFADRTKAVELACTSPLVARGPEARLQLSVLGRCSAERGGSSAPGAGPEDSGCETHISCV